MIKYDDNNIYVGYIKQLLKSFNLPRCHVYKEEFKDLYNEKTLYIKDNFIYRGDKIVDNYKLDDKIVYITDNLSITSNIYDTQTHKYLGDYLRFIRDYTGLDLMSMYNCFTNECPLNIDIEGFESDDDNYQVFILPIKFNKTYTIGLDCFSEVVLKPCFYNDKDLVEDAITKSFNDNLKMISKSGTRFYHPFTYESPKATSADILNKENVLRLLIKIPCNCKSSIVVLEGDYTRNCDLCINKTDTTEEQVLASTLGDLISYCPEDDLTKENKINYFINKSQLFYLNTGKNYLLADRLIEYLSRAVIDSNEVIYDNIRLVQKEISRKDFVETYMDGEKYYPVHTGTWNDNIRTSLYNYIYKCVNTPNRYKIVNTYFDMLGYYDKDVESTLYHYDAEEAKTFEK